jgi:hypothetical protein
MYSSNFNEVSRKTANGMDNDITELKEEMLVLSRQLEELKDADCSYENFNAMDRIKESLKIKQGFINSTQKYLREQGY